MTITNNKKKHGTSQLDQGAYLEHHECSLSKPETMATRTFRLEKLWISAATFFQLLDLNLILLVVHPYFLHGNIS